MHDKKARTVNDAAITAFRQRYTGLEKRLAFLKAILIGLFILLFTIPAFDAFINLGQYPALLQLRVNLAFTGVFLGLTALAIISAKYNLGVLAYFAFPAGVFSIIDEHNLLVLVLNMTLAIAMYEFALLGGFFQRILKFYEDYRDEHELERAARVLNASFKHHLIVFLVILLVSWTSILAFEIITLSFGSKLETTVSIFVIIPLVGYAVYMTMIKSRARKGVFGKKEEEYVKVVGKYHHEARKKG
ncbi:MAG: hypothetical protein ACFFD4_09990 [Candidatus Odinarchaeota archaeon]